MNPKNQRHPFKIYPVIDWYIFREFMIPFLVLLLAFVFLFMIGDLFADLGTFASAEAITSADMLNYFLLKIPGNVRFIFPISLLLACMYTMSNFGKHSEITAMRASGISLVRCGLSIYAVASMVTLITFALNEGVVPDLDRAAKELRAKARNAAAFDETYSMLVFRSADARRAWFFEEFNESGDIQNSQIILHNQRMDGSLEWELRADSACYVREKGWTFYHCQLTPYPLGSFLPGKKEFKNEFFLNAMEVPESQRDIMLSIKPPDELPMGTLIRRLHQTNPEAKRLIAKYETILYFRFAFPWSCLIGVMMGIPLAGKGSRGGVMMSIVIAGILIVVYLMCAQIFGLLGQNDRLPSWFAGLGPTIFFFFYALYQIRKTD